MLAQNFKTAAELQLDDIEYEAHVKLLGMLERNELHHVRNPLTADIAIPNGFNLGAWRREGECGTVACIGGWAELVAGVPDGTFAKSAGHPIRELRIPDEIVWEYVTVSQAAIALRNYLTHGEPRWAEVMAS